MPAEAERAIARKFSTLAALFMTASGAAHQQAADDRAGLAALRERYRETGSLDQPRERAEEHAAGR